MANNELVKKATATLEAIDESATEALDNYDLDSDDVTIGYLEHIQEVARGWRQSREDSDAGAECGQAGKIR
jgi:hypothetical protein